MLSQESPTTEQVPGDEQGDPLGPVYCAVVLSLILGIVRTSLRSRGIVFADVWYMDGGQIICQTEHANLLLCILDV